MGRLPTSLSHVTRLAEAATLGWQGARSGESRLSESAGGTRGLVRSRPGDDLTASGDDLAVIQEKDRDRPLTAELLDLRPVPRIRRPGPRPQAPTVDPLDVIRVPGVVEGLRCPPARMRERGRWTSGELLQRAGIEDHVAELIRSASATRAPEPRRARRLSYLQHQPACHAQCPPAPVPRRRTRHDRRGSPIGRH